MYICVNSPRLEPIYTHTHAHTQSQTQSHTRMYVCMYIHTHTHTQTQTHTHTHTHTARKAVVTNPRYCRSGRSASFGGGGGSFDAAAASEEEDWSFDADDDLVDAVPTARRLLEMTPVSVHTCHIRRRIHVV